MREYQPTVALSGRFSVPLWGSMCEYQPTVAITPEDTEAALYDYEYKSAIFEPPLARLPFADSSGIPTVLDKIGVQSIEEVLIKLSNAISWLDELRRGAEIDEPLPGVEYSITLDVPSAKRIQVRGVVKQVIRNPSDFAFSDGEWDSLGWLEDE